MLNHFTFSLLGIFVSMDIIGVLPLYLGITRSMNEDRRNQVLRQSMLVASAVAISFALIGRWIFKFLGIAIFDFKIGGGIVLLVMAILDLVHGRKPDDSTGSTGVVPLAVPMITGPALIATLMLQVGLYGNTIVLVSLLINFGFAWFAFRKSALITRAIGVEGTDIVSKIGALFMTAIACSMIRSGIFEAIKS